MASATIKGEGYLIKGSTTTVGSAILHVMGRDTVTGRWSAFEVPLTWHEFDALYEHLSEEREDKAQGRIC